MLKLSVCVMAAALLATPGFSQRVEMDGQNVGTADSGYLDVESERDINGSVIVENDSDGPGLKMSGEADITVEGNGEPIGGTTTVGQVDDVYGNPDRSENPTAAPNQEDDPSSRPGETIVPAPEDDSVVDADSDDVDLGGGTVSGSDAPALTACSDPASFEAQRAAFLEDDRDVAPIYIKRVDVSVCAFERSPELVAHLLSFPAIAQGLEHMEIDRGEIVSASWTDDQGLLIYTARNP